jgi:hypothetical protein
MKTNSNFWSYIVYFFLKWEMFQTKVVEKIKTPSFYSITFFLNRAICEIMWKNTVQPGRPHLKIWHMRIGCWILKSTNTHSEYVLLLLLFHCNNGWTNMPYCYITRALPVVLFQGCSQMWTVPPFQDLLLVFMLWYDPAFCTKCFYTCINGSEVLAVVLWQCNSCTALLMVWSAWLPSCFECGRKEIFFV